MADASNAAVPRSGFVTALAWSFIILAAFSTIITLLQNIMISVMFPMEEMRAAMREAEKMQPMPPFFRLAFEHFQLLFALALVSSVVTLVASIGLLRRRNWARLVFIVLMLMGVAWNLSGLALPFFVSDFIPDVPEHPEIQGSFKLVWNIFMGFTILMCLLFAALFAWLARRLMSDDIRREFVA